MRKLTKKSKIMIGVGAAVLVAGIAIPVGVVLGIKNSSATGQVESQSSLLAAVWGDDPKFLPAPELTQAETDRFSDYGGGVFVNSSLDESTIPGPRAAYVTFSYPPKSGSGLPLLVKYWLNVAKAPPAKTFANETTINGKGREWDALKGSTLQQVGSASNIAANLKLDGYTGYSLSKAPVIFYADLAGTTVLTEQAFANLARGQEFFAQITLALDTVRYASSKNVNLIPDEPFVVSYPLTTSLKAKFMVKEKAVPPPAEQLVISEEIQYGTWQGYVPPKNLGSGYVLRGWEKTLITAQNSPIKNEWSLPVGFSTPNDYALNRLNAGTEYNLTYIYIPDKEYFGEPVFLTTKWKVTICLENRNFAFWNDYDSNSVDTTKYRQGEEPAPLITPDDSKYINKVALDHIDYYLGYPKVGEPVSAEVIKGLAEGDLFTAVFVYKTTPNCIFINDPSRPDYTYTLHFKVAPGVYKIDKSQTSVRIPWSLDPLKFSAPPLTADDFADFSDYDEGKAESATTTSTTEIGEKVGTITFVYRSKTSNATVRVTYAVDIVKAVPLKPWPTANQGTVLLQADAQRGSSWPINVGSDAATVDEYLAKNGYVGYSADYATASYSNDQQGNDPITLQQYQRLAPAAMIFGRFTVKLDTAHYDHTPDIGTLVVAYKVLAPVPIPNATELTEQELLYIYGTLPDVSGPDRNLEGYSTSWILSKIQVTGQGSPLSGENSPRSGDIISDPAKLRTLNVGTQFVISWSYPVDKTKYYGDPLVVTRRYTVEKAPATAVHLDAGDAARIEYGSEEPAKAPPISAPGYGGGIFQSIEILAPSFITPGENSPGVGENVTDLNKVKLFNSGTMFTVTWTYPPDPNHFGENSTAAYKYLIVPKVITLPAGSTDTPHPSINYTVGTNPDETIPRLFSPPKGVTFKRGWYQDIPDKNASLTNRFSWKEVMEEFTKTKNPVLYAFWEYEVDPNYSVTGQAGSLYLVSQAYNVV